MIFYLLWIFKVHEATSIKHKNQVSSSLEHWRSMRLAMAGAVCAHGRRREIGDLTGAAQKAEVALVSSGVVGKSPGWSSGDRRDAHEGSSGGTARRRGRQQLGQRERQHTSRQWSGGGSEPR
jgi:hypothetical protein